MGLLLGDGNCKTQFLRQFKFVMVVEYMTDDNTRGKQNLEIVMKTEDDQKHMNTILRKRHYTAQSFFVFPEPSLATFQKNMTVLENKMNNVGDMSEVELDWALNLTNYFERVMGDIWNKANAEKVRRHEALTEEFGTEEEESEEEEQESDEEESEEEKESSEDDEPSPQEKKVITLNDTTNKRVVKIALEGGSTSFMWGISPNDHFEDIFKAFQAMDFQVGALKDDLPYIIKSPMGSTAEAHEVVSDWCPQDGVQLILRGLFKGGGKRALTGATKVNVSVEAKKDAIMDELNLFHLKVQASQSPFMNQIQTVVAQVKGVADATPKNVASQLFQSLPNTTLKSLAGMTGATNIDKKIGGMTRLIFADQVKAIDQTIKGCNDCEMALRSVLHFAFLTQFADEGKGGHCMEQCIHGSYGNHGKSSSNRRRFVKAS